MFGLFPVESPPHEPHKSYRLRPFPGTLGYCFFVLEAFPGPAAGPCVPGAAQSAGQRLGHLRAAGSLESAVSLGFCNPQGTVVDTAHRSSSLRHAANTSLPAHHSHHIYL